MCTLKKANVMILSYSNYQECLFIRRSNCLLTSGYQGIQNLHTNTELPQKKKKGKKLSKEDKKSNRDISSQRVGNEHATLFLKRFKIISDSYRHRRKRFGLRFNLIAAICNFERKL